MSSNGLSTTKKFSRQQPILSKFQFTTTKKTNKPIILSKTYKCLKRDCLRRKQLYVDLEFPPTNSSLFLEVNRSVDIVWKRPGVGSF